MSYGIGMKVSPDIVTLLTAVNEAGDEKSFDEAKRAAMSGIENALTDVSLDATMKLSYEWLDHALEMGKYMEPPTTDSGVPLNEVMASLMSMVNQVVFVVAEFMQVMIDAAKEYMKNANEDRLFGLAEQLLAMKSAYDKSIESAQSQHDATMLQAITTIVEGALTMVVASVSAMYAGKSASMAKMEADEQKVLAGMEVDLRGARKTYEKAETDLASAPTDKAQLKTRDAAKVRFEEMQKSVDTQKEKVAGLQTYAGALSAFSGAINAFTKAFTVFSAGGNAGAAEKTLDSKQDEAAAQYAKSSEGVGSTIRQSGDDAVRAALELINSLVELLKSAASLVAKGPSTGY